MEFRIMRLYTPFYSVLFCKFVFLFKFVFLTYNNAFHRRILPPNSFAVFKIEHFRNSIKTILLLRRASIHECCEAEVRRKDSRN